MQVSDVNSLIARWPRHTPLACLATMAPEHEDGITLAAAPTARLQFSGKGALEALENTLPVPIGGDSELTGRGWMVCLSYELGATIEPAASLQTSTDDPAWPTITLLRCEGLMAAQGDGGWESLGDASAIPSLQAPDPPSCRVGPIRTTISPADYQQQVAAVVKLIHDGDCFQANIAQRFTCPFSGSIRALAASAFETAAPRFGALLEIAPGRAIVSMSPELFLDASGGVIRTRPIKGTRAANVDPAELETSAKDQAELAMIVDLMRNDLGRICSPGSIRVTNPRSLESLPTVHHAVAEVQGTLRTTATLGSILRATFPPGSVTGAPKVRAMQIIEALEGNPRGPYCGAIGWLDDSGRLTLSVAIRTIVATGTEGQSPDEIDGRLDYFAGCGIVAESSPQAEYEESMAKAEVFRQTIDRLNPDGRDPAVPSPVAAVPGVLQCNERFAPQELLGGVD